MIKKILRWFKQEASCNDKIHVFRHTYDWMNMTWSGPIKGSICECGSFTTDEYDREKLKRAIYKMFKRKES